MTHPLVEQTRLLFERACVRVKKATQAKLTKEELHNVAKKLKACPDDQEAIAADLMAQAFCFAEHQWIEAAKQVTELAASLLANEPVADQVTRAAPTVATTRATAGRSTIAGLKPPQGSPAKKAPRR